MNTEQKMKALRMCCDDDSMRITLAEPFLYDLDGRKVAVATDAHVLIMFYNTDGLDIIRDNIGLNIKQVMIGGDDKGILDVERFRRAYEALPRLPYIEETCPECCGEGEVEADYIDRNGRHWGVDAECPVCGGDGLFRKAGTSIGKSAISICGEAVSAKYSERLAELLTVLDNPKDLRLSVVNGNGLRRVILQNDEVYIIIMCVAITDENDIKIVNY